MVEHVRLRPTSGVHNAMSALTMPRTIADSPRRHTTRKNHHNPILDCVRTSKTVTNNMYLSYSQPLLHNHSAQAAIVPIPRSFIFGALYRESRRKSLHYCRFSTHPTMLRYAETRHLPSGKGSVVQSWRSTPIASLFAPCTCRAHTCCPQESSLSVRGFFRAIARHW